MKEKKPKLSPEEREHELKEKKQNQSFIVRMFGIGCATAVCIICAIKSQPVHLVGLGVGTLSYFIKKYFLDPSSGTGGLPQ